MRSMLQHSRTNTGKKEPTDINSLADEYLRLAYHGFRAKDKSFNVNFEAELAEDLPKMNVVAQDIGSGIVKPNQQCLSGCSRIGKPEGKSKDHAEKR